MSAKKSSVIPSEAPQWAQVVRCVVEGPRRTAGNDANGFLKPSACIPPTAHLRYAGTLRLVAIFCLVLCGHAFAADPAPAAAPTPPDRREIWIPADKLGTVLKNHPNAVLLSREQYEALLRDAGRDPKAAPEAPRRALLRSATYRAQAERGVLHVDATFTLTANSDTWVSVPLIFADATLGAISFDGEAAVIAGEGNAAAVLVRGRGEHKLTVEFTTPIVRDAGLSRVSFDVPPTPADSVVVNLPAGVRVESDLPLKVARDAQSTTATLALTASAPRVALAWRASGEAAQQAVLEQTTAATFTIDAGRLLTEATLALSATLGDLPATLTIPVPEGAQVLAVEGDLVAQWTVEKNAIALTFQPGERRHANLRISLAQPSLGDAATATLALTLPAVDGAQRIVGGFTVQGDAGVLVQRIDTTVPQTGGASADSPGLVASYKFAGRPALLRATVERVTARFDADLDTLVEFKPEAIFIERTVTIHEQRGRLFTTALTLPAGEEMMTVRTGLEGKIEPYWRREEGKIRLRWSDESRQPRIFKIRTRIEPEKWTQLAADPFAFTLGDAKIDGVDKVTGYIALQPDPTFRLEAEPSETLERRDGRTTPIHGSYAWFRRGDFALTVRIAKRPLETFAALTGYVLPLEGMLDLHAQVAYTFLHSGARSVRIRVPEKLASNFHFDGPQIAERNLAGDTWTILFQADITGLYALRISAQVPIAKDAADPSHFAIDVPLIVPLDVARSSGVWAVEANTETEITFTTKGLNELDTLLAPALADYQPRHRVIGVFGWLGDSYALALSGVRHASANVVTTVVDQLDLDTLVSTSGAERNQATLLIRTAGAQFLDVTLPAKSALLSLVVDDEVVKPVSGRPGELRVQLPAKTTGAAPISAVLVYETPKSPWHRRGDYRVIAPRVAPQIPVLRSRWRLFVPDGYEISGLESNLRAPFEHREPLLVTAPVRWFEGALVVPVFASRVPLSQKRALALEMPPEQAAPDLEVPPPAPASAETAALREQTRRTEYDERGQIAIDEGDKAMTQKDYETAIAQYKAAYDIIANTPATKALRDRALDGFCTASCRFAEQRIAEGRYLDAQNLLKLVLDEKYNPRCREAIVILARLETPAYYNGRVDPKFRGNAEEAKKRLAEADGFFQSGRYDLAMKRTDELLTIDPYNIGARKLQEKIHEQQAQSANLSYQETRGRALFNVDRGWESPARRFDTARLIETKLARIVIPKLEFREATLREAVEFMKRKVIELDSETDVARRGVSMVLKLAEPAPGAESAPDPRITLSLANTPWLDAMRAIAAQVKYKVVIEPYAVTIVPESTPTAPPGELLAGGGVRPRTNGDAARTERITAKLQQIILPRLEFREATLREAVDYLKKQSIALDTTEPDPAKRGVNITLRVELPEDTPESRITVSLANIPLIEALKYVTALANMKFKIEPNLVVVVAQTVDTAELVTREFKIRPGFIARVATGGEGTKEANAPSEQIDAREFLKSVGVSFPGEATATFIPGTSRLIVRNTPENLDLMDTLVSNDMEAPARPQADSPDRSGAARTPGLLPMKIELPPVGQQFVFEGFYGAEQVEFHYEDWWARARRLWMWFVAGGFLCALFSDSRPWWRTCWAVLILSFLPLCLGGAAICNALLGGWLTGLVLRRFAARCVFAPKRQEVLA